MMRVALLRLVLVVFALALSPIARGAEPVVAEEFCNVEGFSRPLRQTIIVVDQMAVEPWAGGEISENNRRWINAIVTLAGVQDGQRNANSAPRERISVALGKSSGSDLVRIFTGCPPTYSREEIEKLMAGGGGVGRRLEEWLGKDPKSRIEADQRAFRARLLGALVQLTREPPRTTPAPGDFFSLLPEIGRSFELGNGIPRIILFSPLRIQGADFAGRAAAREAGFQRAGRSGADLKRAEVYIVRGKSDASPLMRDYLATLLLGSKGYLVDWSGETMPALQEPPQTIGIYGGSISYGQIKAPMQVRLAIDASGGLVNSWVEVTVDKAIATPMTGKAICPKITSEGCTVTGDGKDFAQAWVINPDPSKPTFDPRLPFSGIRWFEFSTSAKGATGKFADPMVVVNKQKEMPFELGGTPHVRF
jgi:hypothetical protein